MAATWSRRDPRQTNDPPSSAPGRDHTLVVGALGCTVARSGAAACHGVVMPELFAARPARAGVRFVLPRRLPTRSARLGSHSHYWPPCFSSPSPLRATSLPPTAVRRRVDRSA